MSGTQYYRILICDFLHIPILFGLLVLETGVEWIGTGDAAEEIRTGDSDRGMGTDPWAKHHGSHFFFFFFL